MKSYFIVLLIIGLSKGFDLDNGHQIEPRCSGVPNGRFIADRPRGCDAYIQCIYGIGIKGKCPSPFYFNELKQLCDYRSNVDCRDNSTTTTLRPDTTTSHDHSTTEEWENTTGHDHSTTDQWNTTTGHDESTTGDWETTTWDTPTPPSVCNADGAYVIPHHKLCSKYILCFDGVPNERQCAPNLHFSPYINKCIRKSMALCTLEYPVCPSHDNPHNPTFYPHPYICNKYFMCYHGELIHLECSENNVWDKEMNWCTPNPTKPCFQNY